MLATLRLFSALPLLIFISACPPEDCDEASNPANSTSFDSCVPSSCNCGDNGTWLCTSDCKPEPPFSELDSSPELNKCSEEANPINSKHSVLVFRRVVRVIRQLVIGDAQTIVIN